MIIINLIHLQNVLSKSLLIDCHWYLSGSLMEIQLLVRETGWRIFSLDFLGLYCAAPACSPNACYSCHILLWGWEQCSGKLTWLKWCSDIKREDPLVIAKVVSLIWLALRWHGILWTSFVISHKHSRKAHFQRRRDWSPRTRLGEELGRGSETAVDREW